MEPITVLRAAHAELLVTDLDVARHFYVDLLGFVETERDERRLYLRCLEEREHHSLVLRKADHAGAGHIAFRVASPGDLQRLADLATAERRPQRWVEGEELGQGTALRTQDPCGLPLEFYHQMEPAPRLLQQYHLHGPVQVMRLDHFNCQVPDVEAAVAWYRQQLCFHMSEYTVAESAGRERPAADSTQRVPGADPLLASSATGSALGPAGERLWAAWLYRKHTVHDIALMNGIGPRLHHVGFLVPDALAIIRVCDVLAAAGYHQAIERGPGRHGLSNALFLYLRDPDGNRIEFYACDYLTADPDAEPIRWTLDDPRRATFWGHAPPACWFDEAMAVESVHGEGFVPQRRPILHDRPDHVT
jgi:catechol 2,3-dioxygenase-like lactoylglutathione lyase family enzyme